MFVRKGTVRKTRGCANRRQTPRHRRDSSEHSVASRKSGIHDDPSSTGSGVYRLSPNGELAGSRSVSLHSFTYGTGLELERHSPHITDVPVLPESSVGHPNVITLKVEDATPKSSPARSHTTMVSFDDERQLVRTSVGWDHQMSSEDQPDYGAFMYQIREANKESENFIDFGCKTSNIICNTLFVTVFVGLSMAVPVAMVSVGVKYLEDCPKEPRIPIYLLVGGCFGMIKLLSTLWRNIQSRRYQDIEVVFDDQDSEGAFANTTYRTMDTILFLFLIGWQIAGTYWTLHIWTPHFEQLLHEPSNWCDKTVYMFTVYQLSGSYGVMVVFVLVLFVLMCCQRCCYR